MIFPKEARAYAEWMRSEREKRPNVWKGTKDTDLGIDYSSRKGAFWKRGRETLAAYTTKRQTV